MNLFYLDENPHVAAQYHCDTHVRKMIVESCQMLANAYTKTQLMEAPRTQKNTIRGHSYYNHPVSNWVRRTSPNFYYTLKLATSLCNEYTKIDGDVHFCESFVNWMYHCEPENLASLVDPTIMDIFTLPHLAMPVQIATQIKTKFKGDHVLAYREYYKTKKMIFTLRELPWTYVNRVEPDWLKNG